MTELVGSHPPDSRGDEVTVKGHTCANCSGDCCLNVNLLYIKSGKKLYKNSPQIQKVKEQGFIRKDNGYFICEHYDESIGNCQIYDTRPYFCKRFYCNGHGWKPKDTVLTT